MSKVGDFEDLKVKELREKLGEMIGASKVADASLYKLSVLIGDVIEDVNLVGCTAWEIATTLYGNEHQTIDEHKKSLILQREIIKQSEKIESSPLCYICKRIVLCDDDDTYIVKSGSFWRVHSDCIGNAIDCCKILWS